MRRAPGVGVSAPPRGFLDLHRPPDSVSAQTASGELRLTRETNGRFTSGGIVVTTTARGDAVSISLAAPAVAIKRVHLRWRGRMTDARLLLGDAWERGYGDLERDVVRGDARLLPPDVPQPAPSVAACLWKQRLVLGVRKEQRPERLHRYDAHRRAVAGGRQSAVRGDRRRVATGAERRQDGRRHVGSRQREVSRHAGGSPRRFAAPVRARGSGFVRCRR